MKRMIYLIISITLFCIASSIASTILKYDRTEALKYAKNHCKKDDYNQKQYRDFPNDCTSFASQVLIAGGISFNDLKTFKTTNRYGGNDAQPVNIAANGKPPVNGLNIANTLRVIRCQVYTLDKIREQ